MFENGGVPGRVITQSSVQSPYVISKAILDHVNPSYYCKVRSDPNQYMQVSSFILFLRVALLLTAHVTLRRYRYQEIRKISVFCLQLILQMERYNKNTFTKHIQHEQLFKLLPNI